MKLNKTLIALAGALTLAASSHAALLVYEPYDYTNDLGTAITGLAGGTSYGTNWTSPYPAPNAGASIVLSNGLSFPGLTTVGKAMRWGPNANQNVGRTWGDTSGSLEDGATYWYSFLAQVENPNGRGTFIPFKSTGSGDGQNGFGLRVDQIGDVSGAGPRFKAWSPSQAGGSNLDFPGGNNVTYFILGRLVINQSGNSVNTIWVYPYGAPLPKTEPTDGGHR